ncbi:MAG: ATP synthase F1 subunit epsilon [Chloroflexi bacterium]|nr:ATP synthase F1 subunit epsilon [Chloroflexota bacterium]MDA1001913.1 ATP synthase F1 subunit epsilon [Chloroflexota bacterium]MQC27803.1 ATP synthase F1 subunit epsilon [Chloroflexota bacterium]
MPLTLSIVTADRTVLERDDVLRLVVPTTEGQITLLPSHAPLMASLSIGEMIVHVPDGPIPLAIHGGFIQIVRDDVSVLADAAEHADEIDEARAEAARERSRGRIEGRVPVEAGAVDILRAQLSLQRSLIRLRVRRRRSATGVPTMR